MVVLHRVTGDYEDSSMSKGKQDVWKIYSGGNLAFKRASSNTVSGESSTQNTPKFICKHIIVIMYYN